MPKKPDRYIVDCPELISYWNEVRNNPISPSVIGAGSGKKVWWRCPKCGHEWESTPAHFRRFLVCPRCHVEKIADVPEMMRYFSKENPSYIETTIASNNPRQKVLFECPSCSSTFARSPRNWHNQNLCPDCIRKRRKERWYATHSVGRTISSDAELLKWFSQDNEKNPSDIPLGSSKSYKWVCPDCGYSFCATAKAMSKGASCPDCRKDRRGLLFGFTGEPLSKTHPLIAKFWDGEKNGNISPDNVSAKCQSKVFFRCASCGSSYLATPASRIGSLMCCSDCAASVGTSFPEQAVLFYLSKTVWCVSRKRIDGVEFDIYIPSLSVAIEYDGSYYHREGKRPHIPTIKEECAQKNGLRLLRIVGSNHNEVVDGCIYIDEKHIDYNFIMSSLQDYLCFDAVFDVNIQRDAVTIFGRYIKAQVKGSLAELYPSVAAEWNYERNGSLAPSMVKGLSSKVVWWRCAECGYEWQKAVAARTATRNKERGYTKCPACGHRTYYLSH